MAVGHGVVEKNTELPALPVQGLVLQRNAISIA
jgi:hypothetical protein